MNKFKGGDVVYTQLGTKVSSGFPSNYGLLGLVSKELEWSKNWYYVITDKFNEDVPDLYHISELVKIGELD